jgi:hypothetical protein
VRDGTCHGRRKDGSTCQSRIVLASGLCALHDPDRQAQVQAARTRGGQNKARTRRAEKLVPSTLRPVLVQLLEALNETRRGEMDPKIAGALAALAGAIVRVYSSATVEQQIADLQDQVDRLRRGA